MNEPKKSNYGIVFLLLLMNVLSCSDDNGLSPSNPAMEDCVFDFDTPPVLSKYVPPEYPESSKERGVEGTVLLKLYIDSEGAVFRAMIIQSDVDWACDRAAKEAVLKFEFIPARKGGIPCCARMAVPVRFKLED